MLFQLVIGNVDGSTATIQSTSRERVVEFLRDNDHEGAMLDIGILAGAEEVYELLGLGSVDTRAIRSGMKL